MLHWQRDFAYGCVLIFVRVCAKRADDLATMLRIRRVVCLRQCCRVSRLSHTQNCETAKSISQGATEFGRYQAWRNTKEHLKLAHIHTRKCFQKVLLCRARNAITKCQQWEAYRWGWRYLADSQTSQLAGVGQRTLKNSQERQKGWGEVEGELIE